jgi:hypothetical protein
MPDPQPRREPSVPIEASQQEATMASPNAPLRPGPEHMDDGLADDLAALMRALRDLVDPYRPEQHYMRGPGPKWHAKHAPAETTGPLSPA